jgi:hypothetical protein
VISYDTPIYDDLLGEPCRPPLYDDDFLHNWELWTEWDEWGLPDLPRYEAGWFQYSVVVPALDGIGAVRIPLTAEQWFQQGIKAMLSPQ